MKSGKFFIEILSNVWVINFVKWNGKYWDIEDDDN